MYLPVLLHCFFVSYAARFFLDLTFMEWTKLHLLCKAGDVRYLKADSTPTCGREWFIVQADTVCSEHLVATLESVQKFALAARAPLRGNVAIQHLCARALVCGAIG